MSQTHELQSFPEYFEATLLKEKTHEVRHNGTAIGLGYSIGDTLLLREYDPATAGYTGRSCELIVTYISPVPKPWIVPGYSLMSTRLKNPEKWYHKIFS